SCIRAPIAPSQDGTTTLPRPSTTNMTTEQYDYLTRLARIATKNYFRITGMGREDMIQECVVLGWELLGCEGPPRPNREKVIVNRMKNLLRRELDKAKTRNPTLDTAAIASSSYNPVPHWETVDLRVIARLKRYLTDKQAQVFERIYFDKSSHEWIAEELGTTVQ